MSYQSREFQKFFWALNCCSYKTHGFHKIFAFRKIFPISLRLRETFRSLETLNVSSVHLCWKYMIVHFIVGDSVKWNVSVQLIANNDNINTLFFEKKNQPLKTNLEKNHYPGLWLKTSNFKTKTNSRTNFKT